MKKRLLSLFLAFVTLLGILPTAALAANTEEEALGEVDIYNGGYELSYLTINGRIRTQDYTYFNYVDAKGQKKEVPAYCVNPNIKGVPQTVGVGESIKYLANERSSDPKVVGIISNGYPHRSLGELKLDNKYQAYYATKMALWCYLLPNWNIANLKVAPGLTGSELDIGNRILAAAKDIYKRGTTYNYMLEPRMTATPDKSAAYSVTVDGKQYKQQVFTIWSETWVYDYDIAVSFADPGSVPQGTRIVDENDQDITAVTTKWTGDGYGGKFKVLYPADSIEGESGSVQLSLTADVAQYAAMYAVCQEKDKYGNLQNYICDLDNSRHMELAAVSSYTGGGEPDPEETALKIVKLEEGTKIPLEGAVFSVYDPEGRKVGSFSTGPDGTVIIPLTLEGHYTVTEEIPPAFHLLPEERTQHADVEYNKVATVTFTNAPYGSLRVQKLSDTGDALNGVTVQIKHIESGEVQTAKTKIGGVAVFDQLQPGGWEVRELAGISGWIADTDTVQTVSVVAGKTSDATIINKELPGLRIIKYERGTMKAMPNVSFEIFRDAESLGIFQTDEFGEILLTDCKPATYRAEERDTGGDGHVLDTTPQEVELKAGDGIKELVFFNDRLPGIHLIKVDSADLSKPIANARFRIKAVDGSWGPEEYTTSEDGTIDLSKLPVGAYVVTELECPGYVVDDAQRIIHLDGNEQAQFVFTNSKLPSLHLHKESADGTPLGGVTYRLSKIEDGSRYLDRTTGPDGSICWEGLEPGVYSLQEVSTVSDHILDPTEYHVELFPGKDATICLQNDKRPNLTIHKSDADTGAPVPGTVFLVKGEDSHSVAEVTTGPDGSATVENLLPGVYEVSEKSVPSPYLPDANPQLVTLYPNRNRDVYFENHKRPTVTIQKENSVTHDPIQYAEFHITWSSNKTQTGEQRDLGTFQTDEAGQIILEGIEDVWLKAGEYYYYPKVLGKQESVDFFRTITIPSAWTSEAEGQVLSVEIQAEAVQAANVTPDFTAEAPWGEELEIEQCVHEADNTVSEVSQQSFLTVSYEGAARNLILAPDNFFRNFPVLMPGDEWEDTFTLVNTTASRAEFFLRTELPEELSETEKELLSKVKLEIREGDSVIYEGDLESEGLWAAKSLGICSPDERKEICFSIRVPSELGNEWALRKSGVKWIFSVEGEDLPQEEGPSIWHSAPKTGLRDPSAAVPIGIAVTGAFLFLTAGRSERRKE